MLDSECFRAEIELVKQRLLLRGYSLDVNTINALEVERKRLQNETQKLQNERNNISKLIGQLKIKGEPVVDLMLKVNAFSEKLAELKIQLNTVLVKLHSIQLTVPNLPHNSVPPGDSEIDNIEIRHWGDLTKFKFTPKDHVELGVNRKLLDFETAAKISSARFVIMHGSIAKLHRALIQFMLDLHVNQHNYQEIYVPYLVNADSLYGTAQLPKFEDDQFKIHGSSGLYLIPTAEVPVTNIARDTIYHSEELPLKYVCHTPCFRQEAGSYGKDMRGMIRQHQFEKVELVQFVKPEDSYDAHEILTKNAETVLQKLELPYRVMLLCAGDIGFAAAKTYDLEVWLPGQQKYREISSCSNYEDFQARRMQARWRNPKTGKPELLHTLNGSGLAVGRTLVAIMENYQDAEGKIHIPKVLQAYMGGQKII